MSAEQAGTTVSDISEFRNNPARISVSDFSSANWTALNFTPGTTNDTGGAGGTLGLGASGQLLPTGEIVGFGVFSSAANVTNRTVRIDHYEVSVIPEPSGAALGLIGLGMLIGRRKR